MDPYSRLTRTGEVLSVLVEADSHHAICGIESLFYTIAMMHINIDVEHPSMVPGQAVNIEDERQTGMVSLTGAIREYQARCLLQASVSNKQPRSV